MNPLKLRNDAESVGTGLPTEPGAEPQPWEMIEDGRYMPRRVRGSCPGRELG
jgi:hypothetical protein